MKCRTCKADLSDDDKFCFECGTTVSESTMVVLCEGRQKDGTPCGTELKESYKFCRKCGKKVDKFLPKKQTPCQGKKEDGSVCGNLLEEDDKFCTECGTHQLTAPVSPEEFSEQLQEPQKETEMESDRNRNVKCPAEDQDTDLQHIEVDDPSVVESDHAIAVEEKYKENTNRDQIQDNSANYDRVAIQESGNKQDSQMDKFTKDVKESKLWAKVVQEGNIQHDAKKNAEQLNKKDDVVSMETDEHVSADMINKITTEKPYSEHSMSDEGKTKSGTESTEPKLIENDKKMGKDTGDSEGIKMSKDEKTQKISKDAKKDSSQNVSSKGAAAGEKNAGKNINLRQSADVVRIHFHSLVSAEFGLTSSDVVIIRFGDDELGGWNSDIHRPELVRNYEDEYAEFKLVLDIPKKHLSGSRYIYYKYVVATDKVQKEKGAKYVWEQYGLHDYSNRTLKLPENRKNIVEWHRYDGIVFPKAGEGLWNKVKNFFKGEIKERVKKDLVQTMQYFLPKFFQDLFDGHLPEVSVDEALIQLEELLHSLRKVYFVDFECYSKLPDYERKISDIILQPLLKSFEEAPLCNWKETPVDSKRRMLHAATVVSLLKCFKLKLNPAEEELLARGLLVRPNHETKTCHDLDCIEKYFPKRKKKQLNNFLVSFIESMATTAESPMIFLCMPLHHFLSGAVKPFDRVPGDCSHDHKVPKWWGTNYISKTVEIFKKGSYSKWTVNLEQVVSTLHPIFEIDYLLPRTFMALLKLEAVIDAVKTGMIPLEVCAATLTFYVRTTRPRMSSTHASKEEEIIGIALSTLRDVCKAAVQKPDERSDLVPSRMFYKIAGSLLTETLGSSVQFLIAGAVQIFLHALSAYDVMSKSVSLETPNTRRKHSKHLNILKGLYGDVRKWHGYYLKYWKTCLENYLKCWDTIFAPIDLPSEAVKESWNSVAENDLNYILREEMLKDPHSTYLLIDLYCREVEIFHPCVQNCLSQLAFKAIETGYSAEMHQLGNRERERFGQLLSTLYEREWETAMKRRDMEEDRIILQYLLTWTPFSHFLKMFCKLILHYLSIVGFMKNMYPSIIEINAQAINVNHVSTVDPGNTKVKCAKNAPIGDDKKLYLLSQTCIEELTQAISVIDQRVQALKNGTVTIRDLSVIKDAEDKFQELTKIMFEKSEEKGNTFDVANAVKIRQIEVDTYLSEKKYVVTLLQLCQHIPSVDTSELDRTIKHLKENKDLCIRDICQPADVETTTLETFWPNITAYKLSAEVVSMLEPMHASYRSNIFLNLWQGIGRTSKARTLEEVYEQVWKPSISKMEEITQKLVNGEILFGDMEKYLGQIYGDNQEKMVEEMMLINLSDGKARERVKQLKQYRLLEACVDGAKTILNVAKAYELSGDFEVIKIIASQENTANKMMKEFDDSLLKTCKFLEDLTPEKTNCLDHFINCKRLVLWLRESMKGGLKELKVFVDLASISAGEGDIEIAKVNCLHAATTGYASLIFDPDKHYGYKELLDKCQVLWKELKADPNLPKKLLDTNRHLEWLKTVKQAHGSVEVTSLAQAEAINSKGIFCVGALNTDKNTTMGLDLQNTLQLTVPDHEESQGHKQYTFEQLQDLQSRLMLVAGKAEQGKDDVDRFMLVFDSVARLANVFIKLNSAGCVLFKHWQTKFLCDPKRPVCTFIEFGQGTKPLKGRRTKNDDVTAVIPKIARFMENCLDKWIGHINQKRSEYLELNYFTTDQLVILQQELVKVGSSQSLDIKIYPLLSAVKENCTYEDLVDAMKKASKDVEVVQMEVDEEVKEIKVDEEVASEETKEKEEQNFIKEMMQAGYSKTLAESALLHVKPDEITEGIIWCSDHLEEEDIYKEDTEMGDGNQPDEQAIPYKGWKKSDQSVMSITAFILNRLEVAKGDIDVDPLIEDLEKLWEEFLTSVSSSVTDYLSVEHLGLIVRRLADKDSREIIRPFPSSFVPGTPNLILCPKADVLSTVLSVYMMDPNQPLPQADEVLVCTSQTTLDQLDVFWRRTIADTNGKIHCMVNSDLLDFEVSDRGERRLEQYMQQRKHLDLQYRLVVVCSTENEYKSRIITALDKFRRPPLPIPDIQHITDYIRIKLQVKEENSAAAVDFDKSSVRVVKSWRAGVGKSLYVKRSNENLTQQYPHHKMTDVVNIPLQDIEINVSQVTQTLLTHILPPGATTPRIFHLDIAHEVQEGVDFLLFNLLILGCLTDRSGYVWRHSPRDLYLIETIPIVESVQARKGGNTSYVHHVFDFLPFLTCRSPQESLDILTNKPKPRDFKQEDPQFDPMEFMGQTFQRPYQYLSRLDQGQGISDVDPTVPLGTPADCLKVLLRHCGVPDPSWAELHHFVWFLNSQLRDFESSSFCSAAAAYYLPGFSIFVLRFLIQMSRDFSTRSLQMSEESPTTMMEIDRKMQEEENNVQAEEEGLAQYQMRRTWESSPHPYLFFNPDGHTITFLGFNIDRNTGNLIDQQTRQVLETAIMPINLYDSLVRNRVPIQEDFDSLPRESKIERLCRVMGNEMPHDPDDTYELTTDNVKKILAIYMRFRCDIPVIIMGETGCGKTRLVKFLCELQTPHGTDVKNMVLMKVHGGTTSADIKRKVEEARKIAQQNTDQYGPHMYTVLFFDEANTTEAIGMIKEIMCDRSMDGNELYRCQNLKFVAACNPYKKHPEALIKRLEQAGLGYHVDADKTTDRLGRVPMRRLVYRVQPLPQSLLPLVWDFGQLNTQIEDLYIRQMVRRYIRNGKIPGIQGLIEVISGVLTASQDFMRQQQDECSFVSLRDVERVLNVMSWFYAQCQEGRTLFDRMDQIIHAGKGEDMEDDGDEDEEEELEDETQVRNFLLDDVTRSLVLALGVCYHACLKNREDYRKHVAPFFRAPCHLPRGHDQIEKDISVCQNVFLENVPLEKNIARNMALKENVFMMVTSIELRIPLFLVGKPGSSKSLAKTIVADAMQGNAAHKDLFKEFKQVQMVSFQCSPLSTPDGIVGTFRQCAQFQKDKDLDRFVSVVVLDEVGLAEDSPKMPLKTLHPLLEDGCQGDEEPLPHKKAG
ncbi:hypothetical protein CHS0354_036771 [Potamilus streckersoni]|uniref:AAA+ ATPase domain-containing protein n=1 Tax=Potamilus streckersoni TaxID=2493646 RepID=A0AAE0VPM3_9BIVA|nr:hypothetical protein CHS0354_036771 [Potamilus streckersoni]